MEMKHRGRVLKIIILIFFIGFLVMLFTYKPKLFVVLSFDYEDLADDEGAQNLPEILDFMDGHDAKGTFFITGTAADKNPGGVREIHARGHSIGLHTYYHNFPIFNESDAGVVAEIYNTSRESIWNRSFKTQEAFSHDLKANQKAIQDATGTTPVMFRAPGLVSTWDTSGDYIKTLAEAGIEIDSSVQQNWSRLEPFYYREGGIIEIPSLMSEKRLDNLMRFKNYARRCVIEDIPLVMYLHPQNLDTDKVGVLDDYLNTLEGEHEVVYIKIEEVPLYFTP
jgi:peptidoglycan/xylan/chitin deacetylase (PgdA/CDA1 family)